MDNDFSDLKGKVVLITGGSSGIGLSCANKYCEIGCNVIVNSNNEKKLHSVKNDLLKVSDNVDIMLADIRDISECEKLIEFTVKRFGKIDILVNNAGIFEVKKFLNHTEQDYDNNFNTLMKGPFFLSKYAVPHFLAQNSGVIVNIGSVWALQGVKYTPCSAYAAAKSAIQSFTQALSTELASDNIRVVAVAPGLIDKNEIVNISSDFSPLGFNGVPSDISNLVIFLSSNKAKFITGCVIPVDGGFTAGRH